MKPSVLLIDGNHMVRRFHHVMPELTDMEGHSTGGLFGFLEGLGKAIRELEPNATMTFWDGSCDPWRLRLFQGYKHRVLPDPKKEEERRRHSEAVAWQVNELVTTVLTWICIPAVKFPQVEADDLIYLASRIVLPEMGFRSVIVSGDKDFLQLVDKDTYVYNPMKKDEHGNYGVLITPLNFQQETGLRDGKQFLEFRVLTGDDSDHIPGIPGVGDTTAVRLLEKFGSLNEAYKQKARVIKTGKRFAKVVDPELGEPTIGRNLLLMDLSRRPYSDNEVQAIREALRKKLPKMDLRALDDYSARLEAYTFSSEIPTWAEPLETQREAFAKLQL